MNALLLTTLLAMQANADEKIIQQLEADFEQLLKEERNPQLLRDAARLLEQTNQSDRWTNYSSATALLRRSRSKAAVPLLLKFMFVHGGFSTNHVTLPEYAATITVLTGVEVRPADREKLVRDWWVADRDKITTDPAKMTPEQRGRVADQLLKDVRKSQESNRFGSRTDTVSAGTIQAELHSLHSGYRSSRPSWQREDLHPALLPHLLAGTGYLPPNQKPADERDTYAVSFAAIPLLAALRQDGEADELDRIARDPQQPSSARLTCLVALHHAGEDILTTAVLPILEKEKKLERRLLAIQLLAYCRDTRAATPKLLDLLDDGNREVRAAAVFALQKGAPPEALPKLKKVIEEQDPALRTALNILAAMKTREAQATLADYLAVTLEDQTKSRQVYEALRAFETACDQRWVEAGAHDDAYYRDKAKLALAWWKKQ